MLEFIKDFDADFVLEPTPECEEGLENSSNTGGISNGSCSCGFRSFGRCGIIQDVKVLSALGVKTHAVISALTVQNENRVFSVNFRDWEEMRKEIEVLTPPRVIKVGLSAPETVKRLREMFPDSAIVWNVVLESSSGFGFQDPEEVKKFVEYADYVILNSEEAKNSANTITSSSLAGTKKATR